MSTTILDVMGDYTGIRTLVSVSRCSKLANQSTKQLIDRKTRNAQEMRQLVLDIFPTIKNLAQAEDVNSGAYYRFLLEAYFTGETSPLVVVSHTIGRILDTRWDESDVKSIDYFLGTDLKSSNGRKRILEAIQDWKQIGWPYSHSRRLQIIEDVARQDFSVIRERIDSSLAR